MRPSTGNAAKSCAYSFHRKMRQGDGRGSSKANHDGSWNALRELEAKDHDRERNQRERRGLPVRGRKGTAQRGHAVEKIAGHLIHAQAKKIADLRASDQYSDAVG